MKAGEWRFSKYSRKAHLLGQQVACGFIVDGLVHRICDDCADDRYTDEQVRVMIRERARLQGQTKGAQQK